MAAIALPQSVGARRHDQRRRRMDVARAPHRSRARAASADYYFIAQWFPKVAVLEAGGLELTQFHAATEFYADYGTYDVRITVPEGWVVGATGRRAAHARYATAGDAPLRARTTCTISRG